MVKSEQSLDWSVSAVSAGECELLYPTALCGVVSLRVLKLTNGRTEVDVMKALMEVRARYGATLALTFTCVAFARAYVHACWSR